MKNNNYPLLDKVNSPLDLRKLDNSELKLLADDIRAYILEVISQTGGHLAAGLGTVNYLYPSIIYSEPQLIKSYGMWVTNATP